MIDITQQDEQFMELAIEQANNAEENGDVPIGAVIVYKNQIVGKAYKPKRQADGKFEKKK